MQRTGSGSFRARWRRSGNAGRNSDSSKRNRWIRCLKGRLLLLLATVLPVLGVSTACTSTQRMAEDVSSDWRNYIGVMVSMVPSLPEMPEFPELHWTYADGLYSLGEEDVDSLLDYGENAIPLYRHEIQAYELKMESVLSHLAVDYSGDRSDE